MRKILFTSLLACSLGGCVTPEFYRPHEPQPGEPGYGGYTSYVPEECMHRVECYELGGQITTYEPQLYDGYRFGNCRPFDGASPPSICHPVWIGGYATAYAPNPQPSCNSAIGFGVGRRGWGAAFTVNCGGYNGYRRPWGW